MDGLDDLRVLNLSGMMTHPRAQLLGTRRHPWSGWLRRGLDLLFPPRCVACSRMGAWFCDDCIASVEPVPQPVCPRCGRPAASGRLCPQCRAHPTQLAGIRSAAVHAGAIREAIHHFKYQRRRELATPLGEMLFTCWQQENLPVDLVVPVPLHPSRQRERGFNQAGLLAAVLAQQAELPLTDTGLVRTRATAPQVGLGAHERKSNVRDAFVWRGQRLDGRRVLLVDDVCTTGATLEASGLALGQGGADSVWALTLARPLEPLA